MSFEPSARLLIDLPRLYQAYRAATETEDLPELRVKFDEDTIRTVLAHRGCPLARGISVKPDNEISLAGTRYGVRVEVTANRTPDAEYVLQFRQIKAALSDMAGA